MSTTYSLIVSLTEQRLPIPERRRALRDFAQSSGWRPSDELEEYAGTEALANGHLVVEHGLDRTAVITFLSPNFAFPQLGREELSRLLSISYNNLVDWHFFPERSGLYAVNNRTEPRIARYIPISQDRDVWRAEAYDRIVGRKINPNYKSLDDALIDTISYWKRCLATDLGTNSAIGGISALFNIIIFVRALEDQRRHLNPAQADARLLLDIWNRPEGAPNNLGDCLRGCLSALNEPNLPFELNSYSQLLSAFNGLERDTVTRLFLDFYDNKFAPYRYDFSLISKHALSRIYEHYVSILRDEDSPQLQLFKSLPAEETNRMLGGVYTPQYIARFFARFLKENTTPRHFRTLKTIDPACGSGIFLRTVLEMQCDPLQDVDTRTTTPDAFSNVTGFDIDPNACEATKLSLYLLHLVLAGTFPPTLRILNEESLSHFLAHPELREAFDAVIANPPFIRWERILPDIQDRVLKVMGGASGRPDMFTAMLKMGMQMVSAGGYLLYVLPHSFLIAASAKPVRAEVFRDFNIRILADLSEIPVFENVGTYVILLVLQRKSSAIDADVKATIVKCRDFVGHALQDALEGKRVKTDFYEIFDVKQSYFSGDQWSVAPEAEVRVQSRLQSLKTIDDILVVREGMITGADPIFIRKWAEIPKKERAVWVPLLSDKEMLLYTVPDATESAVFYPYIEGTKATPEILEARFPQTWAYLSQNANALKSRRSVTHSPNPWWSPVRPRAPKEWNRKKIVCPHLVISPKFSLDEEGRYLVSRSPFLYLKRKDRETETLMFMLAILNSSVTRWQIAMSSHKYSRGYFMMEPKTLKGLRMPDPVEIPEATFRAINSLVARRLKNPAGSSFEPQIDDLVAGLYGLSREERSEIGIE